MSEIANQLTLNGLADGTPVSSANAGATGNAKGSGVTWAAMQSGTHTTTAEGHGARLISTTGLTRFDGTLVTPASAVRAQVRFKRGAAITADHMPIVRIWSGSNNRSQFLLGMDNKFYGQAPVGQYTLPASAFAGSGAVGDVMLLDIVWALNAAPSGANGRVFYRLKNLTNPTWDTDGEYFYDSLYTRDLGTTTFTAVRFGIQAGAAADPGILFEFMGIEAVTVNPAHTSEAQAKAYFADTPVDTTPLAAVGNLRWTMTRPSSPGGSDGKVTASWDAVANAAGYEARIAPGSGATTGWTETDTNATSPKEFTGKTPGPYTVQVRPKA